MADPLDYLPYALAAHGGTVDGYEAQQLVASGLTLLQRSAPLVRALAGRRAALLLPTGAPFITALAASEGRGAVMINPLAAPAEVAHQLEDAGVGAVFTTAALAARVPSHVVHVLLDEAPRRARVVAPSMSADVDLGSHFGLDLEGSSDAAGADEECAIVYTSAMHGRPLGAILSHRNLITNARATALAMGQSGEDHVLAVLPWAHLFGLTVTASSPLLSGARITTMDRFHAGRVVELLSAGGVTEIVGFPAVFKALLAAITHGGGGLRTGLRLAVCGGAVLEPSLQDQWFDATGVELRQGYGLTEAGPVCLFNRIDRANERGTLGVPIGGVEVAILGAGPDTVPLQGGAEGEISVRGANVFTGYVSGGEQGLTLTADGWLRTGDLGVQLPTGAFQFRDLIKPMFTRGGFNVYPREVEHVIGALPGVQHVVVEALPDAMREHEVAVAIEGTVTEDEVRRWCESRLNAYKRPTSITIR